MGVGCRMGFGAMWCVSVSYEIRLFPYLFLFQVNLYVNRLCLCLFTVQCVYSVFPFGVCSILNMWSASGLWSLLIKMIRLTKKLSNIHGRSVLNLFRLSKMTGLPDFRVSPFVFFL